MCVYFFCVFVIFRSLLEVLVSLETKFFWLVDPGFGPAPFFFSLGSYELMCAVKIAIEISEDSIAYNTSFSIYDSMKYQTQLQYVK